MTIVRWRAHVWQFFLEAFDVFAAVVAEILVFGP